MSKRIFFLLLGIWLSFKVSANQEIPLQTAWEAIKNQQYSTAIETLDNWLGNNPEDYDAQYLLAKVYAWNKQVTKGIEILDSLISRFPENTDFLLSKATFLSWQNQPQEAIALLTLARSITPAYQDIWKLELTLRKRQLTTESTPTYNNIVAGYERRFGDKSFTLPVEIKKKSKSVERLGFGYGQEHLDNGTDDWREVFVNYSRENEKRFYSLQADIYKRFGINDQQLTLQYLIKNYLNYQITSFASLGLEHKLLPTWSAAIQANRAVNKFGNAELFYKHNQYVNMNADIFRAAYSHIWEKIEPKFHVITSFFNNTEYTWGFIAQTTYYHDDSTLARVSYSENTEVEYSSTGLIPYYIKTISLDGKKTLSKRWDINLALTYQMQGKTYNKNGIHTGLFYRF